MFADNGRAGELKEDSHVEAPTLEEEEEGEEVEEEEEEEEEAVSADISIIAWWRRHSNYLCQVKLDDGIIAYTKQINRLPNVTASSICQNNFPQNTLRQQGFFRSGYDGPGLSWLCIDFKDARVEVKNYRVRFGDNAVRFVLEGSTDGVHWLPLDDGDPWANKWTDGDVPPQQMFRFLRFTSKQDDYLGDVEAFEFFGTLFIDNKAVEKPYCVMEMAY